jgi:hypothetical protein
LTFFSLRALLDFVSDLVSEISLLAEAFSFSTAFVLCFAPASADSRFANKELNQSISQ